MFCVTINHYCGSMQNMSQLICYFLRMATACRARASQVAPAAGTSMQSGRRAVPRPATATASLSL
jgi:hypothetical protein